MGLIAWRNIWRHKLRSTFLTLCVVIGVAFVAGTYVLTDTIKQVYTQLFDEAFTGMAVGVRTHTDIEEMAVRPPLPAELVDTVSAVPGVKVAAGGVFAIGGRIYDKDGKAVGMQFAPTFLADWPTVPELNSFRLVRGKAPGQGQVVIDLEAADKANFALGDQVRVQTFSGVKTFTLSGVAKFGDAGNLGGASTAMFDLETAQAVTNRVGQFDSIGVVADEGVTPDALQDRVQAAIGAKYEALTSSELSTESSDAINSNMSFFSTFLLVFAVVALFVGAFIVYNTFAIVVAQRTREMALLRALGASGSQVIGSILVESIAIGLVASAVGLVGGIGLALALKALMSAVGFSVPTGRVQLLPRTVIVSIFGGVMTTVVSAIAPAIRAANVPPLAAVRSVNTVASGRKLRRAATGSGLLVAGLGATVLGVREIELRWLGVGAVATVLAVALLAPFVVVPFVRVLAYPVRQLRGVAGQLAEENAARGARRTATTAAALMIGTALIAASLVLASSIGTSVDKLLDQGLRANLIVRTDGFTGIGNAATDSIAAVPGVVAAAPYRLGMFKLGDATKQLGALRGTDLDLDNPAYVVDLDTISGSLPDLDNGGIAVSKRIADERHLQVGDTVSMVTETGPYRQTVKAIFKNSLFGDYLVSISTHQKVFTDSTDYFALVRIAPDAGVGAVTERLKKVLETAAPSAKVQTRDEYAGDVRAQVRQMLNLITALVLLAILIALLGVLITMLLSVFERTHELGLLRAIGMDRSGLRSMVRWEAAIVATFGATLGIALGIGLGYALTRTLRDQGVSTIELPYRSLLIVILLITVSGVAASLYPARRAGRLNVLQAIAAE